MTPHIQSNKNDIAKTVLMPGDPLRAKYIAENFLENYRLVNSVRNMFAYTGTYKGKEITVFASGMGMPSVGIYSYELFTEYEVENIIRIGTAGSYTDKANLFDIVLAESAFSESSFAFVQNGNTNNVIESTISLNNKIKETANVLNQNLICGRVHCSDVFYKQNDNYKELVEKYDCLAVDMESFALFNTANMLNKKATCLLTISDNFITQEKASVEDREKGFNNMMILALETALNL